MSSQDPKSAEMFGMIAKLRDALNSHKAFWTDYGRTPAATKGAHKALQKLQEFEWALKDAFDEVRNIDPVTGKRTGP